MMILIINYFYSSLYTNVDSIDRIVLYIKRHNCYLYKFDQFLLSNVLSVGRNDRRKEKKIYI